MALRELLAFFKIDVNSSSLKAANTQINATKKASGGLFSALTDLRTAFLALAAVTVVSQLKSFITGILDSADATAKLGTRLGLTIEEFQTFEAFAITAGSSTKGISNGLRSLAKNANDFANGGGEAADTFEALGLEVQNTNGELKNLGVLAEEALIGLAGMTDETKRVAFASELFGKSGSQLLTGVAGGVEALKANMQAARDLGVVYDKEFVDAAQAANDEMFFLSRQMLGVKVQMVRVFLPAIRSGVAWLTRVSRASFQWAKTNRDVLVNSLRSLVLTPFIGGLIAIVRNFGGIGGAVRALMPWVNRLFFAFARFIIPFLIFDDFFAFLDGRKSIIGTVLEEFGLVDDAEESGKKLSETIKSWIPALKEAGKHVAKFYTQTAIAFGALVGMWTTNDEEMRSDFEGVFARNTDTISDFFDYIFGEMPSLLGVWRATFGEAYIFLIGFATNALLVLTDAFEAAGDFVQRKMVNSIQMIGAALSYLASFVDLIFGTNIASSVDSTTANIVTSFQNAWQDATVGIENIENAIKRVGASIQELIRDPIGEVAKIVTGSTNEAFSQDIEKFNQQQISRAQARTQARTQAQASGRTVVLNDQRTTSVQVTSDQPGPVGRAVASTVSATQGADRNRTLAAVQ